MLEVAVYPDNHDSSLGPVIDYKHDNASITLRSINFNDNNNPDNSTMTFLTPVTHDVSTHTNWNERIYDSILSAHHENATIIIDEHVHLMNPGGWSAIYITNGATCVMKERSYIMDGKNDSFYLVQADNANFKCSGEIRRNDVKGFIYAYESSIEFDGISDVNNASSNYIYSENTSLDLNGLIRYTKYPATSSLIHMTGHKNVDINIDGELFSNDGAFGAYGLMDKGQVLNLDGLHSDVNVYGQIRSCMASSVIQCINSKSTITLHESSLIVGNEINGFGVIYINGTDGILNIKGRITINFSPTNENGGAVHLVNGANGVLYPTGEISYHWIHSSGGAVYVTNGSTFTMNGGLIKGNTANGTYNPDKLYEKYGGGGVTISHNGTFIMNDGIMEENIALAGGGVWISGISDAGSDGSKFIMNGGIIRNNKLIPPNANVAVGKDVAIIASENSNNAGISSSEINGHYIQISENAVIGDGFISIAQTNPLNSSQISGYHQTLSPHNLENGNMFIGTISKALENDILVNSSAQITGYTQMNYSLWIASQGTSSKINFTTDFPGLLDTRYDYLVAIAALDENSNILNGGSQIEIISPAISINGAEVNIAAVSGASSYGVVFLKLTNIVPLDLTTSYTGNGQFEFQNDPDNDNKVTLNPRETADITIIPTRGWHIESIQLTAGDGNIYTKTAVNGVVTVNYNELNVGVNNIHAIFTENPPSGSGSGSANITARGGKLIESPSFKPEIQEPVIPTPESIPVKIIQLWSIAAAVYVFIVCFRKNDD